MADRHRLALITPSLSKDDRTDAERLAEWGLRRPEMLNPVEPPSLETQADRTVLKACQALLEVRTKLINSLRGTRKSFGCGIRPCKNEYDCHAQRRRQTLQSQRPETVGPARPANTSTLKNRVAITSAKAGCS